MRNASGRTRLRALSRVRDSVASESGVATTIPESEPEEPSRREAQRRRASLSARLRDSFWIRTGPAPAGPPGLVGEAAGSGEGPATLAVPVVSAVPTAPAASTVPAAPVATTTSAAAERRGLEETL
jgi:hypothetical protein